MSGFEIAGLVLGALPILFKAVDFSKDGFSRVGLALHKRKNVQKLARALLLQQQILEETVKSVLLASGCEDVGRLDNDPTGYLADENVQEEVLDYLGVKNDVAFSGALEQSYHIVQKVAKSITGLVPTYEGAPDDLLAVITANRDANGRQLDFLPRIKLAFNMKDIKEAAAELDDTTNALERFTRLLLSNHRAVDDKSSKKAVKLAKALRHIRAFATNLSLAISQGWGTGCHSKHEARLFLEDRVDSALDILKNSKKDSFVPILAFQLIFAAGIDQEQKLWHETIVQVFNEEVEESVKPPLLSKDSDISQVTFSSTTSEMAVKPDITTISDICIAIKDAGIRKEHIHFAIVGNQRMGSICIDKTTKIESQHVETMTLNSLFSAVHTRRRGPILPLKFRMLLALRLASNMLQLLQTEWLQSSWSKDMVRFQLKPESGNKQVQLDLGRPFVSLMVDHSIETSTHPGSVEPKVALLELGILLLEIWHEITLEDRFELMEAPKGYYVRLGMAVEWLDDTDNPLPELYDRAVSHCIQRQAGEARATNWDDMKFWGTICGEVIEPLSKNCRQWR